MTEQGAQLEYEYEWAHLPGAVSLRLKQLAEAMEQLDRSRPGITYCNDTL